MGRNRRPRIYDQDLSAREGEPLAVQVIATDRNANDTLTYSIVSGNDQGLFEIDSLTGIITRADGGVFDFETDPNRYDLRVKVTDDGNPPKSRTADVTIRITDVNDAPNEITVSDLSVDENAAGAVIGTVAVADQDDTGHVLAVDDARFEIVGDVLKLKDGVSLDHEGVEPVTVGITATDAGGASLRQEFTVTVNDLNERPTDLALSNISVDENAAGAVVGTVTVTDPDDPNGPFGSHALSVADDRFEIVDGVLKLKDGVTLNHEAGDTVTFTITADDGFIPRINEQFEIAVNDVNEAPTAIGLSGTSVDEATAGAAIGTVEVTDPDDPGQPFGSHAITVSDARFEVVGDLLKLRDDVTLDYETADQISLTITATDGGGSTVDQAFDIAINNVNDAPTAIGLSNNSVDEHDFGATIGAVVVDDPDDPGSPFGSYTFAVADPSWGAPSSSRFEVVDGVLKLKDTTFVNHEFSEFVPIVITATDGTGASFSETLSITVNDINEPPYARSPTIHVVENQPAGATMSTVLFVGVDDPTTPFGMHTFNLLDDAGGLFVIDSETGDISTTAPLDHEAQEAYSLNALVTDGGGLSTEVNVTVKVTDVNEAPSLTVSANTVPEESAGHIVGTVSASDPDRSNELFGQITLSVNDDRFEVVWKQLKLKDGVALDFETEPEVTLTITATDGGGLSTSETVIIPVADILDGQTFIPLASLDGGNGVTLVGTSAGSYHGYSVSSAGDVNGDGFDDVIVGAPDEPVGGAGFVVFGSAAGWPATIDLSQMDGNDGFRLDTSGTVAGTGVSVGSAGDINGDGFGDLFVGAVPALTTYAYPPDPGAGYIVFGKAAGWAPTLDLSTLDGGDGLRLDAGAQSDFIGWSIAGAGDVNGDGFDDLIVSNPSSYGYGAGASAGYVVFGQESGWPANLDVTTLDGTNGMSIDGIEPETTAIIVGAGGDFDGDGVDDLLFGLAPLAASAGGGYYAPPPTETAYIAFGRSDWSASLDLSMLDGGSGVLITGLTAVIDGPAIGSAGDVNGDGIEDIIVGSPQAEPNGYGSGSAFVIFGSAAGWPDVLDVSTLDGTTGFRIDGREGDNLGRSVGTAGDVNGDGVDDLLIGAAYAGGAGAAYVVYGQAGGVEPAFDVGTIDGQNGFRLDGIGTYDLAGFSVRAAGDVNGDGFGDLVVGAPLAGEGGASTGESYIVFGGDFSSAVTTLGTAAPDTLAGTAAADSLIGAQGDDLLVGNGGADVLYGGSGDDILAVGDLEFSRIDGRGGTDTLQLDGAGQSLDLTAIGNAVIEGVEQVDLAGSGDNALTLEVTDLLALSDQGNDLFVAGDAGDQVTVVGAWQSNGPATVDGVTYDVFAVAGVDATLYVEDDVAVAIAAANGV